MNFSDWRTANDLAIKELPFQVAEWVAEFGSLTEKLSRFVENVQLDLLKEGLEMAPAQENELLGLDKQQSSAVREVLLYGPDKPWIFARTVMPQDSAFLVDKLGQKPLGTILFSGKQMRRQFLQIRQLTSEHRLYQAAKVHCDLAQPNLWARRSLWLNNSQPQTLAMLVCEVFLPDSPLYQFD